MNSESWTRAWGRSLGNDWEHIFPSRWAWPSGARNRYDSGHDFFYLHWEVKRPDSADRVYLHVEAPRTADDAELNGIKCQLVEAILSREPEVIAARTGLEFVSNARTTREHMAGSKLTSAFSVKLPSAWLSNSASADMLRVHDVFAAVVDESLAPFVAALDGRFSG